MSKKEELLKQYLNCATRLSGHLNTLKSIPSLNFSSLDQKRMATLQNGIDALKILAQKLNTFSEGDVSDTAVEKVAVEKAIKTAEELEGDQTSKSQAGEPGDVDEMVRKIFEAEELTDQNDFRPAAGAPDGAKDINDWTPEINSIDDMNEAFSQYVAQDYYRRATGRENFALHIGNKSISTNPKDYWNSLKFWGRKTNKKIDEVGNNLGEHYPSVAGGIKVASQGALIGAALDVAISSLKRNLSYDEYVEKCKLQGIEPIEKSKYTIGSLEDLKKSLIRGGSIGAIGNLALKGGKGAMEGLNNNLAAANFALTPEDFQDASKMAEEQSLNIMKQSFSLSRGYYPGNSNSVFLDWLGDNAVEYFSLRTDIYNQILEEAVNYALSPTIGDTLKGAGIGGAIGGLTGTAVAALKKNKSYDMYKAEAEAKGETPMSRVAYLAKSKEVQKGALTGLAAGAGAGGLLGGSGLGRKGVGAVQKLLGKNKLPADTGNKELPADTGNKELPADNGNNKLNRNDVLLMAKEADEEVERAQIRLSLAKKGTEEYKQATKDLAEAKAHQVKVEREASIFIKDFEAKRKKGEEIAEQKQDYQKVKNRLINNIKDNASRLKDLAAERAKIAALPSSDKTKKQNLNKLDNQIKNIKTSFGRTPEDKKQVKSLINDYTIGKISESDFVAKLNKINIEFFSIYGYYPEHSSDINFQNFCLGLIRNGQMSFRDLANINFNFPQYQRDFAVNAKATVATGLVSAAAGGIGGKLLANRKIKAEEKRLGRPLTQEERSKIINKYVIGGAAGTGLAGAGAAFGIQHAAGKGNQTAQNIVNKVSAASNKVQNVYGQGKAKVNALKEQGERVYKRHIHGIDYQTQDIMKQAEQADNVLARQASEKLKANGNDMSTLSAAERDSLLRMNQNITQGGLARKAMIIGGAGMAYKFLGPMIREAMSKGAEVDEAQVQAMVEKMKAEGRSEDEIRGAVQNYLQAAFFSYAKGFHKYY